VQLERWSEKQGTAGLGDQTQKSDQDQDQQQLCRPSKPGFWSFTRYFTAKVRGGGCMTMAIMRLCHGVVVVVY
jgi:hypothetical protein